MTRKKYLRINMDEDTGKMIIDAAGKCNMKISNFVKECCFNPIVKARPNEQFNNEITLLINLSNRLYELIGVLSDSSDGNHNEKSFLYKKCRKAISTINYLLITIYDRQTF